MEKIRKLIEKYKLELVHHAYLTGWEIIHYRDLIETLEEKLEV